MSHRFKCTTDVEINNIKRMELVSAEEANVDELIAQTGRLEKLATELEGPVAARPFEAARLAVEQAVTCLDIPATEPADWDKILEDLERAEDNLQDRVEAGDEEAISAQATISLLRGILHLFLGPEGERGALFDRTVSMLDDVEMMPILTRPAFSEDWVQLWRVDRIETTIEACKRALELLKINAHLSNARRAVANITLGNAYFDRVRGDRSNNLRLAIEYLEKGVAPGAKDRERFPRQWALAEQSLGNCYAWSQEFDQAEEHYHNAWVYQFDNGLGEDEATTLNNRGIALIRKWVKRVREVSADQTPEEPLTLLDIKRMEAELEIDRPDAAVKSFNHAWRKFKEFPAYQAVTSYNLGRVHEIRADHLRTLGDLFLQREDIREEGETEEMPPDASEEEGEAEKRHREASEEEGEAEERHREASELEEEAEERHREAEERHRKASELEKEAVNLYQRALDECILQGGENDGETQHSFQVVELAAARRLGRLHFKQGAGEQGAWEKAGYWYNKAIKVLEEMRGEYITDLGRYALARQNANLYTEMAFVCCRLAEDGEWEALEWLAEEGGEVSQDDVYKTALEYLEHGQARLLTEMLVRHDAAPRVAEPDRTEPGRTEEPDTLKELLQDFVRSRNKIRRLESELRNHQAGEHISQTVEALLEARKCFDQTVAAIQKCVPDFVVIPDVLKSNEIVDVVPRDVPTALVYFAITDWGTRVFVVTRPDVGRAAVSNAGPAPENLKVTEDRTLHIFSLDDFTRDNLDELLFKTEGEVSAWWQAYRNWQKKAQERQAWQQQDGEESLGQELAEALDAARKQWSRAKVSMIKHHGPIKAGWCVMYLLYREAFEVGRIHTPWKIRIRGVTRALYQQLLSGVDAYLQNTLKCKRIIFVPQLGLRLLPLHALQNPQGKYLIEQYKDIAYTPCAASLQTCRKRFQKERGTTARFLGVAVGKGTTEEEMFKDEIGKIAALFRHGAQGRGTEPVVELVGKQAKEDDVVRQARDRSFIAFACHGQFNLNDPWRSWLQLGEDDQLQLNEVYDKVDLPQAWVVTLGACESGLVDHTRSGGEFVGMPAGFLYAGAPAVIGSLWRVESTATKQLMVDTYKNVRSRKGMQPSRALRRAQRDMVQKGGDFSHPYYWAPFYFCGGCKGWWGEEG